MLNSSKNNFVMVYAVIFKFFILPFFISILLSGVQINLSDQELNEYCVSTNNDWKLSARK